MDTSSDRIDYGTYYVGHIDGVIYAPTDKGNIFAYSASDDKLTIISPKWIPSKEINLHNAKLFIDLFKLGKPYKLIIENNYLFSLIEELDNKKVIGIEAEDWLYEKDDLNNLLKIGQELITNIKNSIMF